MGFERTLLRSLCTCQQLAFLAIQVLRFATFYVNRFYTLLTTDRLVNSQAGFSALSTPGITSAFLIFNGDMAATGVGSLVYLGSSMFTVRMHDAVFAAIQANSSEAAAAAEEQVVAEVQETQT